MTDEDLFYKAPSAESRMSSTAVIERARIGNGRGNLIYPPYFESDNGGAIGDEGGEGREGNLASLVDESGRGEDDLEERRR